MSKNDREIIDLKKNDYIDLTIENLSHDGHGIGRHEGMAVFVKGALPGEKIKAKIIKIMKNYAIGRLEEIYEEASERVEPVCPIYGRCGGCQLQHLSYQAQLDFKRQQVIDNIERIGKLEKVRVNPTLGMAEAYYYRNKAQIPVGADETGRLVSGFYAARSHAIIPFDQCYIQDRAHNELVGQIREILEQNKISAYDEVSHQGLIRHIILRRGRVTGEIMVTLVINGKVLPQSQTISQAICKVSPNIKSIVVNYNRAKTNTIFGRETETLFGEDTISDYIGDLIFKISARSFYQVNPIQTEVLYKKALEYANLTGTETVIDAYSGIGTISLFLARSAAKVYGVEVVAEAVADAKINAEINQIENIEFIQAKAEVWLPQAYAKGIRADVIVVDPPRKGCDQELLDAMLGMQPERIVYVSCNPSTLARDLAILSAGGYQVQEVQPVDMFPMTAHVETVVLMSRVDK